MKDVAYSANTKAIVGPQPSAISSKLLADQYSILMRQLKWIIVGFMALASALAIEVSGVYKLKVSMWTCESRSGVVIARGTVANITRKTLSEVRANLRVFGSGLKMASNSALIIDRVLRPGEVSNFSVSVRTNFDQATRCELWFRNPSVIQIPTYVPDPRR